MDDFIANVYDYPVYGSGRKKLTAKEKAFNKLKNKLLARHKGKYRKRHNNRALKRLFDSDKLVDLMKCKTVAAYKKAYAAYKKAKTELVKKAEEGGCLRIVDRNDMVDIMPEGGIFVGGGIVGGCGELLLEMEPSAGALVGGINVGGIRVGGRKKKKIIVG